MKETANTEEANGPVNPSRRRILEAAGAGMVVASLGGFLPRVLKKRQRNRGGSCAGASSAPG